MSIEAHERELARGLGVAHAIAFAYARHALTGILTAAGLRAGDEVVLSPLTCKVVPLALLSLGLIPVYADISAATLNLDPERAEDAVTSATKAILFQHTYGNTTGAAAVARVASQRGLLLVEDCAQCMPFACEGYAPGSWGRAAIFSNNLMKPLPAGSGGVAATNDARLADELRRARDSYPRRSAGAELALRVEIWLHRRVLRPALYWPLFSVSRRIGSTYKLRPLREEIADEIEKRAFRLSPFQEHEGATWLTRLESVVSHRRAACVAYANALRELSGVEMPCADASLPLYYFPVLVRGKEDLLRAARRGFVELVPWPIRTPIYPIEDERDLPKYGYRPRSCPVAEDVAQRLIGLPTSPATRAEHRAKVVVLLEAHARGG